MGQVSTCCGWNLKQRPLPVVAVAAGVLVSPPVQGVWVQRPLLPPLLAPAVDAVVERWHRPVCGARLHYILDLFNHHY